MSIRVAGTDPGTSGLDVLVLEDGTVAAQSSFAPQEMQRDPAAPVRWLEARGPFDLVAGPSGYGLPLVRASACGARELALLSLVRPEERRPEGVPGFSAVVRAFASSALPTVFLPGVIHLPTVPAHRKVDRIDLGTPDKLCVAALSLCGADRPEGFSACVVELGSAFTACLVLSEGRVVDGVGGTAGAVGWGSGGAWDGEVAYLLSPLGKRDLFAGGAGGVSDRSLGEALFRESLVRTVAGLHAVTPFAAVVLSGRLLEIEPGLAAQVEADLAALAPVKRLGGLVGARVKHAAQGAAVLADGLAGGQFATVVERLRLRDAAGTVLDGLTYPGADALRRTFLG